MATPAATAADAARAASVATPSAIDAAGTTAAVPAPVADAAATAVGGETVPAPEPAATMSAEQAAPAPDVTTALAALTVAGDAGATVVAAAEPAPAAEAVATTAAAPLSATDAVASTAAPPATTAAPPATTAAPPATAAAAPTPNPLVAGPMAHVLLAAVLPYLRPVRDVVRLAGVSSELRAVLRAGYEGSTLGDDVPLAKLPQLARTFPALRRVLLRGAGGDPLPPGLAGFTHVGLVGFAVRQEDAPLLADARDLTLAVCSLAPGALAAVVAAAPRLGQLHASLATAYAGGAAVGVADVAAALRRVEDVTLGEGQSVEEAVASLLPAPAAETATAAEAAPAGGGGAGAPEAAPAPPPPPPACVRRLRVVDNSGFTGGRCGPAGLGAALPALAALTLERCSKFTAAHLNAWRPGAARPGPATARLVACSAFVPGDVDPARWRRVRADDGGEGGGGGGGGDFISDWEAVTGGGDGGSYQGAYAAAAAAVAAVGCSCSGGRSGAGAAAARRDERQARCNMSGAHVASSTPCMSSSWV